MAVSEAQKLANKTLTDLQAKLVAEFNRRNNAGSGDNLSLYLKTTQFTSETIEDTQKALLTAEDIDKLLKALQVLNSSYTGDKWKNIPSQISEKTIIQAATFNSIDTTLDTLAGKAADASTLKDTGCAGACQGLCLGACYSGCTGVCSSGCKKTCSGNCITGCTGKCTANCNSSCGGSCSNVCKNNCNTYCASTCSQTCGTCGAMCSETCADSCSGGDSTVVDSGHKVVNGCKNCESACANTCANTCTNACSTCYNSCKGDCNSACSGCGGTCGSACTGLCQNGCSTFCISSCTGGAGFTVSS